MFDFVRFNSMPLCKEALCRFCLEFICIGWFFHLKLGTQTIWEVLHHASLNSDIFSQESHKIKHLNMQSPFTIIFERTGYFKELTRFECGIVKGSHHWFSSNFFFPRYSTISYTWYSCNMEAFRNHCIRTFQTIQHYKEVHQCTQHVKVANDLLTLLHVSRLQIEII